MAHNTNRGRRLRAVAGMTLAGAAVLGALLWLFRRRDRLLGDPGWDPLVTQVHDLMGVQDRLAASIDRRLRSLEESVARSEAEVRFMASVLGEHNDVRSKREALSIDADRVERPPSASSRRTFPATHDGVGDATGGATP